MSFVRIIKRYVIDLYVCYKYTNFNINNEMLQLTDCDTKH